MPLVYGGYPTDFCLLSNVVICESPLDSFFGIRNLHNPFEFYTFSLISSSSSLVRSDRNHQY